MAKKKTQTQTDGIPAGTLRQDLLESLAEIRQRLAEKQAKEKREAATGFSQNYEGMLRFTRLCIEKFPKYKKSKGIHAVVSGFNEHFRRVFNADPIEFIRTAVERGDLEMRMVRRGPMIYLPGDAPTLQDVRPIVNEILSELGLNAE